MLIYFKNKASWIFGIWEWVIARETVEKWKKYQIPTCRMEDAGPKKRSELHSSNCIKQLIFMLLYCT